MIVRSPPPLGSGLDGVHSRSSGSATRKQRLKRTFDLMVAVAGLPVAAGPMAAIALALLLTQGRPLLFLQERSGFHGVPFRLMKFRTMTDARDACGQLLPDQARLTLMGRFLRRTRLDELPQIFHLLTGKMSVVGPRPIFPEIVAGFGTLGEKRGWVRPGLTGWAQVNGNALLDPRDKIALDIWYVDHQSFVLDISIVASTLKVLLFGDQINPARVEHARDYACGSRRPFTAREAPRGGRG